MTENINEGLQQAFRACTQDLEEFFKETNFAHGEYELSNIANAYSIYALDFMNNTFGPDWYDGTEANAHIENFYRHVVKKIVAGASQKMWERYEATYGSRAPHRVH